MSSDPGISGARRLLILLAFCLALAYLAAIALPLDLRPASTTLLAGLTCPLRTLTGIACPGCGATRAGSALLRADPMQALALNPFFTLAFGTLLASGAASALAPRSAERGLAAAGAFLRTRRGRIAGAIGLVLATIWQTLRLPG